MGPLQPTGDIAGPACAAGPRYTATAQVLHWATAALMFAVVPLAWVMVNMAKDAPHRPLLYTLHKSVGLTVLALAAVRLAWRSRHSAPALPETPLWQAYLASATHWLLYAVLFAMPVSGYISSAAGGTAISYFNLFDIPVLPRNDAVAAVATSIHLATQWAVYGLVLLHLAATAWHLVIRRDGLLDRMLPQQR